MQIAIVVLIGVILYQGVIHQLDKREAVRRETELLNRIMARTYEAYVTAETIKARVEQPVQQEEYGIPI